MLSSYTNTYINALISSLFTRLLLKFTAHTSSKLLDPRVACSKKIPSPSPGCYSLNVCVESHDFVTSILAGPGRKGFEMHWSKMGSVGTIACLAEINTSFGWSTALEKTYILLRNQLQAVMDTK